jgi:hypothetical protein
MRDTAGGGLARKSGGWRAKLSQAPGHAAEVQMRHGGFVRRRFFLPLRDSRCSYIFGVILVEG